MLHKSKEFTKKDDSPVREEQNISENIVTWLWYTSRAKEVVKP